KLLEIDPNNLRALILLSYMFPRTFNTSDKDQDAKLDKAMEIGKKGLAAIDALQPPAGMTPEQFKAQKDQSAAVLHTAVGFAALQKKDYATAQTELAASTAASPNDALASYWLGLAYLQAKPAEYDKGMWAMAHSTSVTGTTALPESMKGTVKEYLGKVYDARHGSTDGLDDLVGKTASAAAAPDGFHVQTAEEAAPPEP